MDSESNLLRSSSQNTKRSKRSLSDDESENTLRTPLSIHQQTNNFPKFIIVQAINNDKPITSLSPFVIEKQVSSIIGTAKSIKSLRNGNLLIECNNKTQTENLLRTTMFFQNKVKVFPHPSLNSSRGVVRCSEISSDPLDEVKEQMKSKGVTDVKRITIKRDGKTITTNTYIFTFNTPTLPKKVRIGHLIKNVEVYVPNPLRCFHCQKFGHHEDGCKAQVAVCGRCAEAGHKFTDCTNDTSECANCHQDHQSNSRICSFWKKEKEILKIKYTENVSFFEARSLFETRNKIVENNNSNLSYANVARPEKSECSTCKILVDKLCHIFPDKADAIRQLVQSTKENQASTSNSTKVSETVDNKQKQSPNTNTKQPEQTLSKPQKPVKVNNTPKTKISLPERSITKTTPADATKSADKKIKLNRMTVNENNDVTISPIPTDSNKFQTLEGMDDEDESGWKTLPDWNEDKDKLDSWQNSKAAC